MKTKLLKPTRAVALFAAIFLLTTSTHAQQKNLIGIYGGGIMGGGLGLRNVSGIIYERKITEHYGIETGAQFFSIRYSTSNVTSSLNKAYMNVPILHKVYTRVLNFAGGPTLNFRIADQQVDKSGTLSRYNYTTSDISIGYLFKLSKSFSIKDLFVLEPEVNISNRVQLSDPLPGAAISFKYKF